MLYQHFLLDANESNAYVVACPKTREAALIDCGEFDRRIVDFVTANQLKLGRILLTHGHWDHVGGLDEFLQAFPEARVAGTVLNLPAGRSEILRHEQNLNVGELQAKIFKTTGHTPDSISIFFESERALFTGDALFAGSIGGTATESRKREIKSNIHQFLLTLPEDTEVFPGHGPASTIGIEKKFNPLL